MSNQPVTLLELDADNFVGTLVPPVLLPWLGGRLGQAIEDPEVREWIEASPLTELDYIRLRWVLLVLRNSKLFESPPSRTALTWRERITGRLSQ